LVESEINKHTLSRVISKERRKTRKLTIFVAPHVSESHHVCGITLPEATLLTCLDVETAKIRLQHWI